MKKLKWISAIALIAIMTAFSPCVHADGTNSISAEKPKPDSLKTCPVSGEKLGEMGKPFVFVYQGQEVKLCCPMCKADFDKDPQKYLKKIQDAANK